MAEPPKPLPRTKLRSAPVRILIENDEELSSNVKVNIRPRPSVPNLLTPELTIQNEQRSSTKDLSTVIAMPDDAVVNESSEKNSSEGDTVNSKINLTTETIRETAGKSDIIEQIDEDDVVDKILGLKSESLDRKIIDKDTSPVGSAKSAKSDNGSPAVKEPPNNDSSSGKNEDLLAIHIHRSDCLKMDRIIRHPSVSVHIVDAEKNGEYLQKTQPNKNVTYNQEQSNFILPVLTRPFNFKDRQWVDRKFQIMYQK